MKALLAVALCLAVGAAAAGDFKGGLIPSPRILQPDGPATGAAFLLSDGAWTDADDAAAEGLRKSGASVVGVDTAALLAALEKQTDACVYLVADIERLSHELERATDAEAFRAPVAAGVGMGGALALDILTQTPADTLSAVVAVDPAAGLPLKKPLCTRAERVDGPDGAAYAMPSGDPAARLAVTLTPGAGAGARARAETLRAAGVAFDLRSVATSTGEALSAAVAAAIAQEALSGDAAAIVELPAAPSHDAMAIVLSGDGGWRDLDKQIAQQLQAKGVPTVGLDTLRWFWTSRTPQATADELARL